MVISVFWYYIWHFSTKESTASKMCCSSLLLFSISSDALCHPSNTWSPGTGDPKIMSTASWPHLLQRFSQLLCATSTLQEDIWPSLAGPGQLSLSPAVEGSHFPFPLWRNSLSLGNCRQKILPTISLRSLLQKGKHATERKCSPYELVSNDLTEQTRNKQGKNKTKKRLINSPQCHRIIHLYGNFSIPNKWLFCKLQNLMS